MVCSFQLYSAVIQLLCPLCSPHESPHDSNDSIMDSIPYAVPMPSFSLIIDPTC